MNLSPQMIKCSECCTSFEEADYMEHKLAHISQRENPKQRLYEFKESLKKSQRHLPHEGCNCPFYGLRDYCEMLQREAA